jgi:hypothetical protein
MRARWKWMLVVISAAALSASGWLVAQRLSEGSEPLAEKIQRAMDEEASKPRFTGRLGDFVVVSGTGALADDAKIFRCASTPVAASEALSAEELWSDAFGQGGIGWACSGRGVVLVNNEADGAPPSGSDGSALGRGYIQSVPVPVARSAPRDRLELVTVEGHPGLLERPIPEYPYGEANLVVIERYPDGDKPGIAVFVEMAPSAEAAIKHAEEIMP